ncbi:MAG: DUF350 domain-containing protein [Pseudomonadota bacterium]
MDIVHFPALYNSLVFSVVGILTLIGAFVFIDVITPKHSLWKLVVEKENSALAIVVAAFLIGVSLIIAAAVHG